MLQSLLFVLSVSLYLVTTDAGRYEDLKQVVDRLQVSLERLVRQNILQRLHIDERTRSEGDSGIKQVRMTSA